MIKIFSILTIIFLIEVFFSPRLDFAGGKFLLWYGKNKRKFIVILKLK